MPLYEWGCDCGHRESVWASMADRDAFRPEHACGGTIRRLPGGRGLLYFGEGRQRTHLGLSKRPIASLAEQKRLMKAAGVTEAGDNLPQKIRNNPQSVAMKRYVEKDKKGRWL